MLLYNSSDPPFARPGNPTRVFKLCCSDTVCDGRLWPPRGSWTRGHSPLGMSLILDIGNPRIARLTAAPTPADISDLALPWECLFCPLAIAGALRPVVGARPAWVSDLIQEQPAAASATADTQHAGYSLVLGMNEAEQYENDQ
jgi:hypothetical protein